MLEIFFLSVVDLLDQKRISLKYPLRGGRVISIFVFFPHTYYSLSILNSIALSCDHIMATAEYLFLIPTYFLISSPNFTLFPRVESTAEYILIINSDILFNLLPKLYFSSTCWILLNFEMADFYLICIWYVSLDTEIHQRKQRNVEPNFWKRKFGHNVGYVTIWKNKVWWSGKGESPDTKDNSSLVNTCWSFASFLLSNFCWIRWSCCGDSSTFWQHKSSYK